MNTIPVVTDTMGRMRDIGSALLEQRIIVLSGVIDTAQAELVTSALLYLDAQPGTQPISLYINSPGGSVTDGARHPRRDAPVPPIPCTPSVWDRPRAWALCCWRRATGASRCRTAKS